VDLTEAKPGDKVKTFKTEEALAEYTKKNGKFFPADHAHSGGLLRKLLRRILTAREEEHEDDVEEEEKEEVDDEEGDWRYPECDEDNEENW
jgi:hypothetical protein